MMIIEYTTVVCWFLHSEMPIFSEYNASLQVKVHKEGF